VEIAQQEGNCKLNNRVSELILQAKGKRKDEGDSGKTHGRDVIDASQWERFKVGHRHSFCCSTINLVMMR
jgi:hypothetical protein